MKVLETNFFPSMLRETLWCGKQTKPNQPANQPNKKQCLGEQEALTNAKKDSKWLNLEA